MKKLVVIMALIAGGIGEAQQPELVLPVVHSGKVRTGTFSPDGNYVVTGGADQVVNLWETFSGKKVRSVDGFQSDIIDLQFSRYGNFLAVKTDSSVGVYRFPSFKLVKECRGATRFRFSVDESSFFLLDYGGDLYQYDITGEMKKQYEIFDNDYKHGKDWQKNCFALSPDNKYLATLGSLFRLYELPAGKLIAERSLNDEPLGIVFASDSKSLLLLTENEFSRFSIADKSTRKLLADGGGFYNAYFDERGQYIVTPSSSSLFDGFVWNADRDAALFSTDTLYSVNDTLPVIDTSGEFVGFKNGNLPFSFPVRLAGYYAVISDSAGKWINIGNYLWNLKDPARTIQLPDISSWKKDITPNGKFILVQAKEGTVSLFNTETATRVLDFGIPVARSISMDLAADGKTAAFITEDSSVVITDLLSGKTVLKLRETGKVGTIAFNADGTRLLTNSTDTIARLWDAGSGRLLDFFSGAHPDFNPAYFDSSDNVTVDAPARDTMPEYDISDPEKIVSYHVMHRLIPEYIRDFYTQRNRLQGDFWFVSHPSSYVPYLQLRDGDGSILFETPFYYNRFALSPNKQWIALSREGNDTVQIYDVLRKEYTAKVPLPISPDRHGYLEIQMLTFTPDSRHLLISDMNETTHVMEMQSFRKIGEFAGGRVRLTPDGSKAVGLYHGGYHVFDLSKMETIYRWWALDSVNYVVIDNKGRFDGTPGGRTALYFSCGLEIVELQQFKDKLWVPDLANRLMNEDSIFVKGIGELQICGYTPDIRKRAVSDTRLDYLITPRGGGLGQTTVLVNGVEISSYAPNQLKKEGTGYVLSIHRREIQKYFSSGGSEILVKAFTADNSVSSRGLIHRDTARVNQIPPNLYAVMVGVSDYKNGSLDLKYAAKDATDLAGALSVTARKLLNSDGREHVFIYELTTGPNRYRMPEKLAIKKTIEEIGARCTPNDILMVFFAGHGVHQKEQNQFYFLASNASSTEPGELADAAISTSELIEWIRPDKVKAQKRILVFDACNSGQAIRDIVSIGKEEQGYVAARSDDKAQQVKLIEKLNERAGFTILSAASSDQSAYEMGKYAQGLLTYALLKTVKEHPDILLNGKYLDLGRWFQASTSTVEKLVSGNKARQTPQLISNANFVIGLVDEEVRDAIKLAIEKPVFSGSILNNAGLGFDNLGISRLLNSQLRHLSDDIESPLIYRTDDAESMKNYSISGTYVTNDNNVSVRVNLVQNNAIVRTFMVEGSPDKLQEIIQNIIKAALANLK